MTLLLTIHYPIFGGPHNQALRLARPLAERGWETVVLLPDESGNAAERLRAGGVEVVQMPLGRLRATPDPWTQARFLAGFWREVGAIRRLIRERSVEAVAVSGLVNPHAAVAARLEDRPVVWQILDTRPPTALRRAIMPLVTRLADVVMSTGMGVARAHPGAMGLGERLVPFFPPVDTREFRPDAERRARARAEMGVPKGACLVGTVSNLNPQKGVEYLVRAAAPMRREVPNLFVRVLGAHTPTHAAYAAKLRREAEEMGLLDSGRLAFLDPGGRVAELLPAFDVFVLASVPRSEGVPTVILEAMACGIPVVATDVGAVKEVVKEGVTGSVVSSLDPYALAGATLRLLRDPQLRHRLGEEGRRHAVERYDVQICADTHIRAFEAAIAHHRVRRACRLVPNSGPPSVQPCAPDLQRRLVCPACRGSLMWAAEEIRCEGCRRRFPIVDGVPVMLVDASAAEHDETRHLHAHEHKGRQADFFDRHVAEEFEITRPHGTPALYRWILAQKFRRSVRGLEHMLPGATALTVCGGSGMDGEFLARCGARVIVSDVSLGAARRARERARRYGLSITPLVADVERLPFRDGSVDLVYVHDGLHHLEQPFAGVSEMARVASRAVSVTEPARAFATAVAVRLGWALEREEAGNRVARMMPDGVRYVLEAGSFRTLYAERYAMYYRHQPGEVMSMLSSDVVFPVARGAIALADRLIGRWGNKLTVTAVRVDK